MDREALERRLDRLEAREAVRELKALYCDICDDDHNPDRITTIFVPDGIWESTTHGKAQGHEAIRARFREFQQIIRASQHMVTNPVIDLNEDNTFATVQWNFAAPMIFDEESRWSFVRYTDDYIKVGDEWKVSHMRVSLRMSGVQPGGWSVPA